VSGWSNIWNSRLEKYPSQSGFQDNLEWLIHLNGFDKGAGAISSADWKEGVRLAVAALSLQPGDSLLELGCGSGAWVKAASDLMELDIFGVDYSASLIEEARRAVPTGNFRVGDIAGSLDTTLDSFASQPGFAVDVTVFHGVLHYLNETDAAEAILQAMDSSRSKVLLAEVPNSDLEHESELHRSALHGAENYKEDYQGLLHTSFNEEWFRTLLSRRQHDWEVEMVCPSWMKSGNRRFRFNILFRRRV